jgi:hypothetical protein
VRHAARLILINARLESLPKAMSDEEKHQLGDLLIGLQHDPRGSRTSC